jgi:hypothetical protein
MKTAGLLRSAVSRFDAPAAEQLPTHSALRAAEINNCPNIALDFGPDSRRGKGRIVNLCNPLRNNEAGPKDKRDWMIIFSVVLTTVMSN